MYFSQVFDDPKVVAKYYTQLGQHFTSNQEYSTAEQLYVKAGMYKEAINMYNQAGKTLGFSKRLTVTAILTIARHCYNLTLVDCMGQQCPICHED
jgi:hypothetical protein